MHYGTFILRPHIHRSVCGLKIEGPLSWNKTCTGVYMVYVVKNMKEIIGIYYRYITGTCIFKWQFQFKVTGL